MAKVPVFSQSAKKVSDASFDIKKTGSARTVAQAIVTARSNQRTVSAHTKTRGEVRGGGKKPWRQKGTGRARHGSTRSPIWIGGGVTFGPRNLRNFAKSMNKSQRTLALQTVLSEQATAGNVAVIEALSAFTKTREVVAFVESIKPARSYLIVTDAEADKAAEGTSLHQAARNVKNVTIRTADQVSAADIASAAQVIITKAAFEQLTA